ncbi:hypothetical protein [Streptomyces sp. NPDC050416]|uniref:hypothetical protein n=1 Tax=Streptomyces sp. NPDC050416 TaxID=3365611 RepID=UPI0037ADB54B
MPQAKKFAVSPVSAPRDRCTVSQILIQPTRTTSLIRPSPCASAAALSKARRAHEIRDHGVRALIVQPAYTRTGFEANSAKPDTPLHAYAKKRQTVDRVMAQAVRDGDAPAVAQAIVAAATDTKPKPRYTAGPLAGRARVLRRLAPTGVFDKQIRKMNQLAG